VRLPLRHQNLYRQPFALFCTIAALCTLLEATELAHTAVLPARAARTVEHPVLGLGAAIIKNIVAEIEALSRMGNACQMLQKPVDCCTKVRYILYRKIAVFRKTAMRLTEKQITRELWKPAGQYKPLAFTLLKEEPQTIQQFRPDALVEVSVADRLSFEALVEIVPIATPKALTEKCRQLVDYVSKINTPKLVPLIVAPYIGKRQAQILVTEGISWLDLCGNMRVEIPGRVYIERTGNKNRYPDTAPIKKIFQGTSALVSRALLLKPEGFKSQYELVDFINRRNANITISTVSRVLKSLEEELLVSKTKSLISVPDTVRLLDRLTEGYINSTRPNKSKMYKFACDDFETSFRRLLVGRQLAYAACGFYAAKLKDLASTGEITIAVKDIEKARERFQLDKPDAEFGNVGIIQTEDPGVWFNIEQKPAMPVVDDIELYLEMMVDTPRGPKVAELLRQRILRGPADG